MASSNMANSGPPLPEQPVSPAQPVDTIVLHVLSPSPDVNGGRITFPNMPLDTKISHLKLRIQNSVVVPAPPERQRLIYRGRPLLNMDTTLREVLSSELNASRYQNPTYSIHLVITPAVPGPTQAISTSALQNHPPQHRPPTHAAPPSQPNPSNAPPAHQHHQQQPQGQLPLQPLIIQPPAMTQAQAAQVMLQTHLNQLQQQIAMTSMLVQGHDQGQGQGQGHGHGQGQHPNQPPQMPPFSSPPPNMQGLQGAIMQQQQMRVHAGMYGLQNPAINGIPAGVPFGHNPVTTRVHETVNADGQRTRVVVNETTFQISRQSTPVPGPNRSEAPQAAQTQIHPSNTTAGPQRSNEPSVFPSPQPHLDGQQGPQSHTTFVPRPPAYQPTLPDPNRRTTSMTTTAWLLSNPNGPQALVFAPGHGFFTSVPPSVHTSTRLHRHPNGLRLQQTPTGRIGPQNGPALPAPPVLNPNVAVAHNRQLEALARARHEAVHANNAALRNILSRVWTFIKLYFVIFMFTAPSTWFRWICLFAAVLVSVMPSTTVFRGFATRIQAQIDGLFPPPAAAPRMRQQVEGQRQAGGAITEGPNPSAGPRHLGEPEPAATAARLLQEHRQRHPNVLRDNFERAERALGLFVASLIPGVGERHVRAQEEARRERERVAAGEEARRSEEERMVAEEQTRDEEVGAAAGQSSGGSGKEDHDRVGETDSTSPETAGDRNGKKNAVAEEALADS